jgi:hypothetical protein
VNKSNGPFDMLLCVGQFFPAQGGATSDLKEYLEGRKAVPLPTYFIGDYGFGSEIIQAKTAESTGTGPVEICRNLSFLGRAGIVELFGKRCVVRLTCTMDLVVLFSLVFLSIACNAP